MKWGIILIKSPDNGWYINYIRTKLLSQINKAKLQGAVSVKTLNDIVDVRDSISVLNYDYITIFRDYIEISDDYISEIYDAIKTKKPDCVGFGGSLYSPKETFSFQQFSESPVDGKRYYQISMMNPIRKKIIENNIEEYISNRKLTDKIATQVNINKLLVFKEYFVPFSICIPAYKAAEFIDDCLNSIETQTYFQNNNEFEVLVGVDGCAETLNKLKEIKDKYRNVSVYVMSSNKGTYITTNTLIDLAKYENIIRFDSDDIMTPTLIVEVIENRKDSDVTLLGSVEMKNNVVSQNVTVTDGVVCFKKRVMDEIAGGYMPWTCAADSEFIARVRNKVKVLDIRKKLFYRRVHPNSLTNRRDTGYNSEVRKKYKSLIKSTYRDEEIKIERIVDKNYIFLSFIIPVRDREEYTAGLEHNIQEMFGDYQYEIIYVRQCDQKLFKRGQLCNIGFKESRGNIVIFQDVDIRHLHTFNPKELLDKFKQPFVAFDKITQLNEPEIGEYEPLKTEDRPFGWGACTIFYKEQFSASNGFSNLIFGWGAEDTILSERVRLKRYMQNLGHVYHESSRYDNDVFLTNWYKSNRKILSTEKNRLAAQDGLNQTTCTLIHRQEKGNITTLSVSDIGVCEDYAYMPLYEECRKNEKLHILLLPDRPEWAFDHITKGIMKYNPYPEKIIYSKEYIKDFPQIAYNMWDYVYIFFEGEQLIPHNKDKTIRGCYSAVWVENLAYQPKFFADKFSHCRGVIFVNDILKNAIEPLMRKNIPNTIIYDSADDALFYLIPEEKSDEFTAIFVGNVKRAVKNFPDIKNACEKTGVKLIVANNVAHDELVNEYAKAHVCINFSTSEGGPQTFAESALCGIPMIIRDTIALSNQIPCFKVSSKEDMIKTLAYLKEHPKECEEMGKKARNTVLSKFTYKEAAKQFAEFFLSLENKQT